jgi:hypothetical protein
MQRRRDRYLKGDAGASVKESRVRKVSPAFWVFAIVLRDLMIEVLRHAVEMEAADKGGTVTKRGSSVIRYCETHLDASYTS